MKLETLHKARDLQEKLADFKSIRETINCENPCIERAIQRINNIHNNTFVDGDSKEDSERLVDVIKKAAEQIILYVDETIEKTQKEFDEL